MKSAAYRSRTDRARGAGPGAPASAPLRKTLSRPALRPRPSQCWGHIARSFRAMLTRADLRERPDARPGPPPQEHAAVPDGPSETVATI